MKKKWRQHQLPVVARATKRGIIMKLAEPTTRLMPGIHHQIELAHVIGGPGHGITDRLEVMKGHTCPTG